MKVCVVSSCGGHLTEVRCLRPAYEDHQHFYVLNDSVLLPPDMEEKTYFVSHSERDWKLILNLWEAFWIIQKERPDVILSAGAGPAIPFALIGKLVFGTRFIFVETITRVNSPSLTGTLMYYLADTFFYQHPSLKPFFPKGVFGGTVI
jgi:UDP-N-acetylglucosamine:LPS N-acetylglucosamine transferase